MRKVIISGADGFVGSNTVRYFIKKGVDVVAVDVPASSKRLKTDDRLEYVCCDLSENEGIINRISKDSYDAFIHFAWKGSSGEDRFNYQLQMQNALNTVNVLKQAKEIGCKRFICAGSIMEYEVEEAVHANGVKPGMGYIYGMGKHIAHCMCKSIAANIGIDLIWPMITNAFGPGEYSPRLINTTLRKIVRHEKLQFTAATQNYDFIYIDDVAKAFFLIAEKGLPFKEYLIGSGKAGPLKGFLLKIRETVAPDQNMIFGEIPYTGIKTSIERFDISELMEDTGFQPSVEFEEAIKRTFDWIAGEELCNGC